MEIIQAIEFYLLRSEKAPENFIQELEKIYKILEQNPHFAKCYKDVRTLKIKRFPYSLYFVVDEQAHSVRILACFHNKRNPKKRPLK